MLSRSKTVIFLSIVLSLFYLSFGMAWAEVITVTTEGEYTVGDGDTKTIAQERAVVNALRTAAEKAGVYVESYTKTRNHVVTDDEVRVIAAKTLKVTDKKFRYTLENGSDMHVIATVTSLLDTDNIEGVMKKILEDKTNADKVKKLEDDYAQVLKENERLKQQNAERRPGNNNGRSNGGNNRVNVGYYDPGYNGNARTNEDRYSYLNYYEKANRLFENNRYEEALAACNRALQLNPNYADALLLRGQVCDELGDKLKRPNYYYQAAEDLTRVLKMQRDNGEAYYWRGIVYDDLGDYMKDYTYYNLAIADFTAAAELDPQDGYAYYWRAIAYSQLGIISRNNGIRLFRSSLADCNKAISLGIRDDGIYELRNDIQDYLRRLGSY